MDRRQPAPFARKADTKSFPYNSAPLATISSSDGQRTGNRRAHSSSSRLQLRGKPGARSDRTARRGGEPDAASTALRRTWRSRRGAETGAGARCLSSGRFHRRLIRGGRESGAAGEGEGRGRSAAAAAAAAAARGCRMRWLREA